MVRALKVCGASAADSRDTAAFIISQEPDTAHECQVWQTSSWRMVVSFS